MRTKSPALVQRWVDSLPNETVTDIVPDDIAIETDNTDNKVGHTVKDTGHFRLKNCKIEISTKSESKVDDIIKPVDELDVHEHTDKEIDNDDGDEEEGEGEKDDKKTSREAFQEIDACEKKRSSIEVDGVGVDVGGEHANGERRFWQRGASVLTALRIRSATSTQDSNRRNSTETQDLNASLQLSDSDTQEQNTPTKQSILNKSSKLNDIYHKLSINKKRYNFIKERKMDAKKLLNDAKSRLLAATNWDEANASECDREREISNQEQNGNETNSAIVSKESKEETTAATATTITASIASESMKTAVAAASEPGRSGAALAVCDTSDMDLSADELSSRLSQSNDILSADDEDSFNVSKPSIDSHHTNHLNVSRRIALVDIGRSTSDNPRLRNKYYLADIGRSFSEHQDDDAIIIGERNMSAPSSSIAIQNNNRSNSSFFERRAYSVSPTQRGLKRGILSRDHSLSDISRHRNQLSKGSSFQSDSSHCSSVESLLDARKPDSEAILRQLGFGSAHQEDLLSRIPKRYFFLSRLSCHFECLFDSTFFSLFFCQ